MTGFIVSIFLFRNRVSPKEAFEGLEPGEGKLSRPVLRGLGPSNGAWLLGELHYGMEIGRTSCTNFWANQFRVLMTAAAYVLMQELRLGLAGTAYARAQVSSLRERFLKLGARVVSSVRRIVLHLPQSFPYFHSFRRLAWSVGAQNA